MSAWRKYRRKSFYNKKINKRLSLKTLQKNYDKTETQIEILKDDIEKIENEEKKYGQVQVQIEQRAADLRKRKEAELYDGPTPSNFLLRFIKKNKLSDHQKVQILRIDSEIDNISKSNPYKNEGYRIDSIQYQIKIKTAYLDRLREAIRKKECIEQRKKQRQEKAEEYKKNLLEQLEITRAIAADSIKQVRRQAQNKKRKLEMPEECPYCGNSLLAAEVHVDHIYPVSKGGKSIPANMVNVCASCNTKKKDMTLGVFIETSGLNYSVIRNRLSGLGKDF
jgi:hypothetical protein